MASSSSLSLSLPLSSPPRSWEHDVFPSFHGPDVRKGFLSHIQKEFERKGIMPFIDNDIKRGESIAPELKRAIQESKIAIVLLSKNYASSSWCLDELVEIMSQVEGQTVLAIFYEVDPTDVKKQTGDFGKVFKKTCRRKSKKKIETWRKALESVGTIAGYHSRNWVGEAAMVENIATDISKILNHLAPSPDMDRLIGMGAHMKRMQQLLRLDLHEVRMIGIWGPPGIGKSTIARFLFNQLSNNFQYKAIMVNIKGTYPRPCLDEYSAQLQLQNQMLSLMINHKDTMIPHLGVAQGRLKDRRVLLVLDDVDQLAQLDALAKDIRWFGPGSRIIITTEDLRVLNVHGMINHIYKVDFPSHDEALQMFCMYAFGQESPKIGFIELCQQIMYLVGKLPLGLKVMGSYFRGMSKEEWTRTLPRLWSRLNGDIESILKFSYDALCDEDKDLFLHIACFFNHARVEIAEEHLAKKFLDVRQRLDDLAKKSLISIEWGWIEMHNLLAQLGKDIVRKQSTHKPRRRLFLVDARDICEVLTDPTAITRSDIGIYCSHDPEWDMINTSERTFERMSNLQFLRLHGDLGHANTVCLPRLMEHISPKLQLFNWVYCPMTSLPFIVNLEFLVELRMRHSKLEKLWEGIKQLRNLKWMDLSDSVNLNELPNLSTATNLQKLDLIGCSSQVDLPSSIGNATNLQELNLSFCSSMVELPSSIGNATNLQILDLRECSSLVELPSSIGNATNLQILDLEECSSLVELPSSIGNATNLQALYLNECSSLVELPSSIGNATNLQELNLNECSSLVDLPSSIGNATNLQNLQLQELSLTELPSSIGNLHRLKRLNLWGCTKLEVLPTNINLESLKELDLTDCSSLKSFLEISTNIKVLRLTGTAIKEVPLSISSWSRLKELEMPYSENLKESPHAFDRITKLRSTNTEIEEIGLWVKDCSRLLMLDVSGCRKLVSLPQLPDSLMELDAENCVSLERLDCSFRNPNIKHLNFGNCFSLNQEARDLIIQTSTRDYSVLPGVEVPAYFTYRSSLTVELNEKPLRTSTKFKACIILLDYEGEEEVYDGYCFINKQKDLPVCRSKVRFRGKALTNHLYIFDFEAEEVTSSTELVVEFKLRTYSKTDQNCKIKEYGIVQV